MIAGIISEAPSFRGWGFFSLNTALPEIEAIFGRRSSAGNLVFTLRVFTLWGLSTMSKSQWQRLDHCAVDKTDLRVSFGCISRCFGFFGGNLPQFRRCGEKIRCENHGQNVVRMWWNGGERWLLENGEEMGRRRLLRRLVCGGSSSTRFVERGRRAQDDCIFEAEARY